MSKIGPSASSQAGIVATIQTAAGIASATKEWVVIVVPDGSDFISAFGACAGGALPPGSSLGGRTAILPGGGKLSITTVGTDPFIPDGTPFGVLFAGWGDDIAADNRRMALWRERAVRIIR